MKAFIYRLIQDDIRITNLIQSLDNVGIDAGRFYLGNVNLIFHYIKINDDTENIDTYNKLIENVDVAVFESDDAMSAYTSYAYRRN